MEFQITLQPGGHKILAEEGESLLAALLRQGWHAPYSCQQGTCGTCRARLIHGEIEYVEPPAALEGGTGEQQLILLCSAQPRSDLEVEVPGLTDAALPTPRAWPVRVADLHSLSENIISVCLQLAPAHQFEFVPGQYVDILLRGGNRRSFSIARLHRPEAEDTGLQLELHIRRVEGGYFTAHVFNQLKAGDMLRLYGPLGTFFLRESTRPVIMVSGGTGFAPMQAMLDAALPLSSSRSFHLFCGMPVEGDLYMRDWAEKKAAKFPSFEFTPVLSNPDETWQGKSGWVHEAVIEHYPELKDYDVYIAGPPEMAKAAQTMFVKHGLPQAQVFTDVFEFAPHRD